MSDFSELKPRIVVVGIGGAGGNAVNNMIASNLEGAEFVVCNTDAQALSHASTDSRIQLGATITQGLGAGAKPEVGRAAAEESIDTIIEHVEGANMVFITAGMGGGTGTGAAPAIARACRERGILTVGVVTKPFAFEGHKRTQFAEMGIEELKHNVDTLIIIPNQNLFRIANEKTSFADAFKMADNVLYQGVRGVTDLMVKPGLVNLDFNDIRTVMSEMGKAMMGTGESDGEKRAITAAESAISNPLLDDVTMKGARGVLVNITGSSSMTMFEVDEAANRIRAEIDDDAEFIFGCTFDEALAENIRVSVVATGIEDAARGKGIPTFARPTSSPASSISTTTADTAPAETATATAPSMPTPEVAEQQATPTFVSTTTEQMATPVASAQQNTDDKKDISADDIVNILQGNTPAPQSNTSQHESIEEDNSATPLFETLNTVSDNGQAKSAPEKSTLNVPPSPSSHAPNMDNNEITMGQTYTMDKKSDGSLALQSNDDEKTPSDNKGSIWSSIGKLLGSDNTSGKSDADVIDLQAQQTKTTAEEITSAQPENQMPVFQSVNQHGTQQSAKPKSETIKINAEPRKNIHAEHGKPLLNPEPDAVRKPSTILDDNDDALEIPAFLRRQAN